MGRGVQKIFNAIYTRQLSHIEAARLILNNVISVFIPHLLFIYITIYTLNIRTDRPEQTV